MPNAELPISPKIPPMIPNPEPMKVKIHRAVKNPGLLPPVVVASKVSDIIINFELLGENNIFICRFSTIVKKSEYFFILCF